MLPSELFIGGKAGRAATAGFEDFFLGFGSSSSSSSSSSMKPASEDEDLRPRRDGAGEAGDISESLGTIKSSSSSRPLEADERAREPGVNHISKGLCEEDTQPSLFLGDFLNFMILEENEALPSSSSSSSDKSNNLGFLDRSTFVSNKNHNR
jgi:hypothetical protein